MSNTFYEYISNQIIEYFQGKPINPGDKFNVQFENLNDVEQLISELEECGKKRGLIGRFYWSEVSFSTFVLTFNNIDLIVASNLKDTTADFLTTLRNKVGTKDKLFCQTAILFIHNTTLDSILGGTESLQKKGMPLSLNSLRNDIAKRIQISHLSDVNKSIVQFVLSKIEIDTVDIGSSIFEYEPIIEALYGEMNSSLFSKFGLFCDSELSEVDEKERKGRLKENYEKFSLIESIHKYSDPEQELEKYFDAEGAESLSKDTWADLDYINIRRSEERKNEIKQLEYEGSQLETKGLERWEKGDGTTKSKERKRNIIIFNTSQESEIQLAFRFDRHLRKENLHNLFNIVASISGKKVIATIKTNSNTTIFSKFQYKEKGVAYDFKIAVVQCSQEFFVPIETSYFLEVKKNEQYIGVPNLESSITFNPKGEQETNYIIEQGKEIVIKSLDEKATFKKNIEANVEDDLLTRMILKFPETEIPLAFTEEKQKSTFISALKVQQLKRKYKRSFIYYDGKLSQGNQSFIIRDAKFKENLEHEQVFIAEQECCIKENNGKLIIEKLEIPSKVETAYKRLVSYFGQKKLLPSLAFWDEELREIAQEYLKCIIETVEKIEEGKVLTSQEKNLLRIGTVESLNGLRELKLSPLHPLNIAYQLQLMESIGHEELPDEILKRLVPKNLLPYIYQDEHGIYKPIDQYHSPEWISYYNYKNSRYNASTNFVSKLVREKIQEFTSHFSYLFNQSVVSPIKLNLVNLGDCREVLQGIFEYYSRMLKDKKEPSQLLPFNLYIYGEGDSYNAFEEFSFYQNTEQIKEHFDLTLEAGKYTEDDLLNAFREKVHFYKRELNAPEYEYCHIAFYEINQNTDETYDHMENIETSVSLGGLISSVTSVFVGDSYRTGFGTKYLPEEKTNLLNIAIVLNSLAQASKNQNPYSHKDTIVTAFSDDDLQELTKIYKAAHWVTFIEPKFDLSFFKNHQEKEKDLLILHYSDQYSSSSSYDAITVTQRSDQYQMLIREFLLEKIADNSKINTKQIINLFNSINGDWLLRLIGNKSHFGREKLSILSAVKFSLSYFDHKDITWIPISLEEILRVSGAAGLKQREGLFSAKNLGIPGSHSDDILMIGIEQRDEEIILHYYPIEVKIGDVNAAVIDKAVKQVHKTRDAIDKFLSKDTFRNAVYRDFLVQLLLVSAKKMRLYNIWPNKNWDDVLEGEIHTKLINDDYKITNDLNTYIHKGAIITFKRNNHFKSEKTVDDVLKIEIPESRGYQYLVEDIQKMRDMFQNGQTDFDRRTLLQNKYNKNQEPEYKTVPGYTQVIEAANKDDAVQNELPNQEKQNVSKNNGEEKSNNDSMKILFGHKLENKNIPLYWYPTTTSKVMHTNTGIIGTMGTGKTQFTKSLITQLYNNSSQNVNGTQIDILIFDYKGDYIKDDFIKATNAKVYDLFHLPYNPLALYKGNTLKPMLPLHTANSIKETVATAFGLGVKQKGLLRDLIMEAYECKGISKGRPDTWDLPAPTISDVYEIFLKREDAKEDSLSVALKDLAEFEIFMPDSKNTQALYDLIDGVTVINLSGYDTGIQNLVVGITLDTFYSQMQTKGHSCIDGDFREITKMILVDEADNFLSKDFEALKKILKEGREFGVGTILSTQFLSHFATTDNDYSQYLLTWIVHCVTDLKRREVQAIFNTESKEEEDSIMNRIRQLDKHQSLVTSVSNNKLEVMEDKPFWQLIK
ncbi:DNA phosphorothioation-dependent restriction protein DptH [Bacillus toyonensis]|uniref:DNA phosphorothioation-dependent restriction protein DptH n=5 Tax=Bacillus toyonensis TaxID=155322 RepID=UPI0005349C11|nr:DNA phosphorothioation-dependent restriction protein DptH [Bacillus toyonensis]HDR7537283.1 DNA phosphorothioation-dependent restriction protein DptH [Bacillus toyonensis]